MSNQWFRYPIVFLSLFILVAAGWAGLIRVGWAWPVLQPALSVSHGALMVAGFFATLISLERAVAMGKAWTYLAPLMSGVGGVLVVIGVDGKVGPALMTLGSACLVLVFAVILYKHRTGYMLVMASGAAALLVGNLLWLSGKPIFLMVLWWAGFLILTIVGERLEISRMVRQTTFIRVTFWLGVTVFLAGLVVLIPDWDSGVRIAGAGMIAMSLWLLNFDIARRTVRQSGLTRFIAVCLLSGYVWLLFSGAIALIFGGVPAGLIYDATLHTVFIGFVFAMIFGHAPIIFPAVLGIAITYKPYFYLPLVLLHLSLAVRVSGDLLGLSAGRLWGGLFNAIAVLLYLGMIAPIGFGKNKLE
ncbi:hypothetical protein KQH40_00020 [bacterium]|nr:hypothetical protein [bacterium]